MLSVNDPPEERAEGSCIFEEQEEVSIDKHM